MVKMKGMGELENLSYKEMRGTYFYETFHFEGVFCHESKHKSSTPKFFEILGGMNRGSQPSESWSTADRRKRGRRSRRSLK